jgi:hypothetical protein
MRWEGYLVSALVPIGWLSIIATLVVLTGKRFVSSKKRWYAPSSEAERLVEQEFLNLQRRQFWKVKDLRRRLETHTRMADTAREMYIHLWNPSNREHTNLVRALIAEKLCVQKASKVGTSTEASKTS